MFWETTVALPSDCTKWFALVPFQCLCKLSFWRSKGFVFFHLVCLCVCVCLWEKTINLYYGDVVTRWSMRGIILFKAHQSHHLLFRFVCLLSSCSWSGSRSSPPAPCYRVSLWPFTYSRGRGHHSSRVQDLQGSHPGAQWEQNIQSESLPGAAGSSKRVKKVSYLLISLFLIDIIIYVNPSFLNSWFLRSLSSTPWFGSSCWISTG